MNGFEQAFELLHGFNFEDKESEVNALWLHHWITRSRDGSYGLRPPMVIITGPHESGKSRLVKKLCCDELRPAPFPTCGLSSKVLNRAARERLDVLLHEDYARLGSKLLARFITDSFWIAPVPFIKRRDARMVTFDLRAVVIVTGLPSMVVSADLRARSVFIRLK